MTQFSFGRATPITDQAAPPLFVNLSGLSNAPNAVFINRIKQLSGWRLANLTPWPPENLTATGELASLPSGVTGASQALFLSPVTTAIDVAGIDIEAAGDYTLTWVGGPTTCTIQTAPIVSSSARSITFTVASVVNIFAIFANLDTLGLPTQLALVKTTNAAAYAAGDVFDPLFLAAVSNARYAALRFMDWEGTNGSPKINWSDKATTASKTWVDCPVAIMVALCNEAMISPYFCLPHKSTEDYWTQFATYVRDNLNPALTARYTWSNEIWNYGFSQYNDAQAAGEALFGTSGGLEHVHFYGYKIAQMARVIDSVYGAQRNYLIVGEWQAAGFANGVTAFTSTLWQSLDPVNYVAPYSAIDEASIAPYFGGSIAADSGIWTTLVASGQAAAVSYIDSLTPPALTAAKSWVTSWKIIADGWGIPLVSYENGFHLEFNTSRNNNLARTTFTVPDGNAYTVGEVVTQTGTAAHAILLSKGATTLELETEADAASPDFNAFGVLTGGTSAVAQTPTGYAFFEPKVGVVDLFEAASYGTAAGGRYAEHLTNCRDAGMRYFNIFTELNPFSKYGAWGLQRWHGDENPRKVAVDDWVAANPRSWAQTSKRRAVAWP